LIVVFSKQQAEVGTKGKAQENFRKESEGKGWRRGGERERVLRAA
jgi:hypothetical protein